MRFMWLHVCLSSFLPSRFPPPPPPLSLSLSPQRALSKVSSDEWLKIPDVGDARNKKERNAHVRPDRFAQ